jgi:aminoglycoside phosphotransferase (APT) family kinase protein
MPALKLHAGEIDISTGLAARLIAEKFPHWAGLPVRPVSSAGTECVLYRLGDDLVIRLPRRPGESLDANLTHGVLSRLAPFLPVPVPGLLAADLAGFLRALWKVHLSRVDLADRPPAYRGGPLSGQREFTLDAIEQLHGLIDTEAARAIWDHAMRLPPWDGPDTWIHADMMPGNILTRNGRLAAVIDFGTAGLGDPAQDLIVGWMLLPASVRPAFRRAVGTDDATWLRGRARALSMALGHLDYYRDTNPVMNANARYTICEILADYNGIGD